MRIDITQLLDGRATEITTDYEYMPADDGEHAVLPEYIHPTKPVSVACRVTENHGYMTLRASAVLDYETPCDRCLDPVTRTLTVDIERYIETENTFRNVGNAHKDEDDWDEDGLLPIVNGAVEIDNDLTEELLLSLPMLHLCAEDCPGLCPRCGKKRIAGGCTCAEESPTAGGEKISDERMAIFAKLLDKS